MIPGYHTAGLLLHDLVIAVDELAHMGYSCVAIRPHGGLLNPNSPVFRTQLLAVAEAISKAHLRSILDLDGPYLQDPRSFRGASLVADDPRECEIASQWIRQWVQYGQELGTDLITFSSGPAEATGLDADEDVLERLASQLDQLVQQADSHEVNLGLRPRCGDAIATVAQFERLAQWLPAERGLRLAADVGEMLSGGELPVGDRLIRNREALACVYLCDRRAGIAGDQRIGHGDVAIERILGALQTHHVNVAAIIRVEGHSELGLIPAREAIQIFDDR